MADGKVGTARQGRYRIAYCVPVLCSMDTDDSSFLQQWLIMEHLRRRGHDVTLVAARDHYEITRSRTPAGPEVVGRTWSDTGWFNLMAKGSWRIQSWLGVPYLNLFSNLRWYDALMRCLPGHDIVQERNGLYKMAAAMACRRLGIPFIYFFDADDMLEHEMFGKPLRGVLRWRARRVLRYNLTTAARVVCLSEAAREHLERNWGVDPGKIAVFPNGVDVDRFRPLAEAASAVGKALGVDDGPVIIFVGSFFPYQDVKTLLRAFALVARKIGGAQLLLVGKGAGYDGALRYAADLGIGGKARFLGFRPHSEIPQLLGAADIAVAPYGAFEPGKFLGSSMKLVEYMAAGLAVVASNVGQIAEVIDEGANGILVPPANAPALAAALVKLIGDRELRLRLGRQARRDAERKFSWEAYVCRLERLYHSLMLGTLPAAGGDGAHRPAAGAT